MFHYISIKSNCYIETILLIPEKKKIKVFTQSYSTNYLNLKPSHLKFNKLMLVGVNIILNCSNIEVDT